jgi:hypothetical protein
VWHVVDMTAPKQQHVLAERRFVKRPVGAKSRLLEGALRRPVGHTGSGGPRPQAAEGRVRHRAILGLPKTKICP